MVFKGFTHFNRAPCVTKLVVFDFDHTLSCYHVFYALAGSDSGGLNVPPPYGVTERGQLARLVQLEKSNEYIGHGGFCVAAMGGPERVRELQVLLAEMHASRIECIVCSRGQVGPIRYILLKAGLLQFFTEVHANSTRGGPGATPLDRLAETMVFDPVEESCLAKPAETMWSSKAGLIRMMMAARRLTHNEVIFVDDTEAEIRSVMGLCVPLEVCCRKGMDSYEFETLRSYMRRAEPMPQEGYGPFISPTPSFDHLVKYEGGNVFIDPAYNKRLALVHGPKVPEVVIERRPGIDEVIIQKPPGLAEYMAPSLLTSDRKNSTHGREASYKPSGHDVNAKPSSNYGAQLSGHHTRDGNNKTPSTTVPSSVKDDIQHTKMRPINSSVKEEAAWTAAQSHTAAPAPPPPPQRLARGLESPGGSRGGSFLYLGHSQGPVIDDETTGSVTVCCNWLRWFRM